MTILCVGISHRQAPIAVRERIAVAPGEVDHRLRMLRALPGVREVFFVSTCNRLDIFAGAADEHAAASIRATLDAGAVEHARTLFGEDALRHLFRVAASLDSMVVGEAQILGQLKEAVAQAQRAGTLGPELRRAFAAACTAAKRVRTETSIARGPVSLSSIAADLSRKVLGDLRDRTALLVGAGKMGRLAGLELHAAGVRDFLVANRGAERAASLARDIGGAPAFLDEVPRLLERADIVVSSAAASHHILTSEMVEAALPGRRHRPLLLVDLAMPRNMEPRINDLPGVYLYDLDDLERVATHNRDLRAAEVVKAEQIVDEELRAHSASQNERAAAPVVARLRAQADEIARGEVSRTLSALGSLDERQRRCVQAMASAIVNKLLHAPTAQLRAEAARRNPPRDRPLAQAATELFGLDRQVPPLSLVSNG
jgi:glutamyl-tRNA reductase